MWGSEEPKPSALICNISCKNKGWPILIRYATPLMLSVMTGKSEYGEGKEANGRRGKKGKGGEGNGGNQS